MALGSYTPGYSHSIAGTLGKAASGYRTPRNTAATHRSCTGLGLGCTRRLRFRGFSARLLHPRPESASSAVTVLRGDPPRSLTCSPCGQSATAGWRPAGLRARPRPAPRGSVGVCCTPRASTRMGRCRLPSCWPHPRPAPALHPALPGPAKKP